MCCVDWSFGLNDESRRGKRQLDERSRSKRFFGGVSNQAWLQISNRVGLVCRLWRVARRRDGGERDVVSLDEYIRKKVPFGSQISDWQLSFVAETQTTPGKRVKLTIDDLCASERATKDDGTACTLESMRERRANVVRVTGPTNRIVRDIPAGSRRATPPPYDGDIPVFRLVPL